MNLATCKECLGDFPFDEMIWGDKGAGYFICEDCHGLAIKGVIA